MHAIRIFPPVDHSTTRILPISPWQGVMLRYIETLLFIVVIALAGGRGAHAQPALKMGYRGAGVAQSLYNTIDKAGLWAKYNLDVTAIYFNSWAITAHALVCGDIDLSDSNIPTMLI